MTEMDYSRGPRCYCGFPDGVERDHPSYNGWSEQSIVEAHADVLETRRKVAEHPNTLEAADGLRRAILDLHRPVTRNDWRPVLRRLRRLWELQPSRLALHDVPTGR